MHYPTWVEMRTTFHACWNWVAHRHTHAVTEPPSMLEIRLAMHAGCSLTRRNTVKAVQADPRSESIVIYTKTPQHRSDSQLCATQHLPSIDDKIFTLLHRNTAFIVQPSSFHTNMSDTNVACVMLVLFIFLPIGGLLAWWMHRCG